MAEKQPTPGSLRGIAESGSRVDESSHLSARNHSSCHRFDGPSVQRYRRYIRARSGCLHVGYSVTKLRHGVSMTPYRPNPSPVQQERYRFLCKLIYQGRPAPSGFCATNKSEAGRLFSLCSFHRVWVCGQLLRVNPQNPHLYYDDIHQSLHIRSYSRNLKPILSYRASRTAALECRVLPDIA